jgi:SAM-dependent methyltransferase
MAGAGSVSHVSTPDIAAPTSSQRAVWAAGDYDLMAQQILWSVGPVVVEAAGIEAGMTVLDVATGTGNAAIRAAQAGATVTGLDLTPELLEAGRARAAEAGVTIDWVEGDAEALPFEDASFDRVLSVFGVMFAPRQQVAAAELARVCKPGGSVVLAAWVPDGFIGRMFGLLASHFPPPAPGTESPLRWGDERRPRQLLGGQLLLAQDHRILDLRPPSREQFVDLYDTSFGPFVLARKALGDEAFEAVLADFRALVEEFDDGDGEVHIPAQYLLTVAHRPASI